VALKPIKRSVCFVGFYELPLLQVHLNDQKEPIEYDESEVADEENAKWIEENALVATVTILVLSGEVLKLGYVKPELKVFVPAYQKTLFQFQ